MANSIGAKTHGRVFRAAVLRVVSSPSLELLLSIRVYHGAEET